ncbi:MAG: bifunctional (p)ppGpp synthetase/guanosine-3',5'-bis(diphosphate) 3'-pyrophosphohydrolase, partial [Pseudomonadota bacterium]
MVKVRDDLPIRDDGSVDLEFWLKHAAEAYSDEKKNCLRQATLLTLKYGSHIVEPYPLSLYRYGLVMAEILLSLQPDIDTLIATVLYPSVRFGAITMAQVKEAVEANVEGLIEGMLRLHALPLSTRDITVQKSAQRRDNLRRMLLALVEDVRVVLIRLSEQVFLLRATSIQSPEMRILAEETREIYAPLANRLGIGQIKWELEDFTFRCLELDSYHYIARLLDEKRSDREAYIAHVVHKIQDCLAVHNIEAEVHGRAKHIYSIWRKMKRKNIGFGDVYDVRAIRILVNDLKDCYAVLGLVHGLWPYIPQEFDDYVASPKGNGYRSLHTAVVGEDQKPIEIQIRTYQMHKEAELGVAAHWLYKEQLQHDASYQSRLATLRQILDWQDQVADAESGEHLESERAEIFDDRVYVFTPKGEVLDLPIGATVLDFAYQVHTELGHRCRGAKVNGAIVPLHYRLCSGDQIEILPGNHIRPSRDWLNPHLGYLKSSKAKARVLQWFRQQENSDLISAGRALLDKECKRLGITRLDPDAIAKALHYKRFEDVLEALARQELRVAQVLSAMPNSHVVEPSKPVMQAATFKHQRLGSDVEVQGIGNLLCHFAHCCYPVPGDPIIGYVTTGRGMTVHRQDCVILAGLDAAVREERTLPVDWGSLSRYVYPVDVGVIASEHAGLLPDISGILTQEKVRFTALQSQDLTDGKVSLRIRMEVSDLTMLGRVLSKILRLSYVI